MKPNDAVNAPSPTLATAWLGHVARWSGCERCPLHCTASQKVFGRGFLNCNYCLIGEGPGKGEDVIGVPFIGRAGKLLDAALGAVYKGHYPEEWRNTEGKDMLTCECGNPDAFHANRIFIMNLVACRPTDRIGGENREPSTKEIQACRPRFAESVALANPSKGVVLLGRIPNYFYRTLKSSLPKHLLDVPDFHVKHPAAILREGGVNSSAFADYVQALKAILKPEAK